VTTLSLLQSLVVPVLGTIEQQLSVSGGAAGQPRLVVLAGP
jgi:hypothetical protein